MKLLVVVLVAAAVVVAAIGIAFVNGFNYIDWSSLTAGEEI